MDPKESSCLKHYDSDPIDAKAYLAYFTPTVAKEVFDGVIKEPIKRLQKAFDTEHIGGDTLIDFSLGPSLHQVLTVCKHFKEVYILDYNEQSIEEMKKWMNKDPDAHDWSFSTDIISQNDDKSPQEIADLLRCKFKKFVKCDLDKVNPTSPDVIPEADCVVSMWILEYVSDQSNFQQHLTNLLSLVKSNGHLILFVDINTTYLMIGKDKFCAYTLTEDYLKTSLTEAGCHIITFDPIDQNSPSGQYDTKKTMFVVAIKNKNPKIQGCH